MDALSFRRVVGGSVIDNPPLFSENGDILFTIINRDDLTKDFAEGSVGTVRAYSTRTGESMHDIEFKSKIVNIEKLPGTPSTLVGCTRDGGIFTWNERSRTITANVQIVFPKEVPGTVETFNIISYNSEYVGLVTWTCENQTRFQMATFDLIDGSEKQSDLLELEYDAPKVAVSRNKHNIIAAIQNYKLFATRPNRQGIDNRSLPFTNASKEPFTAIACHPVEETVAVGDVTGKIFIYHVLFKQTKHLITTLHHWHHNRVETIAFTSSGSLFYSGGAERVLVGWNYKGDGRNVLPRLNGTIVHIAVSSDNQQIAVSTDDNGIIVVSPQFNTLTLIQNFVRVSDDNTPWLTLFPIGLQLDPRTGYIVLNGRVGQVQFYSPHDRTFFNLDVTMENRLSLESGKVLFNTRVTHSACNVDWLVTAECFNDLVHFPEVRLKFWLFDVTRKTYVLNTQIEAPHVNGVTALTFSSTQRVDNLLCASSGEDGEVKLWSLEESEVYSESPKDDNSAATIRKYWVCREKTSYKSLSVHSIAFSSDGSLLAAGFGNALCIYISETLRNVAVLSAPSGQDGSTNKLIVSNATGNAKQTKKQQELTRKRDEIIWSFLENDDDQLIAELLKEKKSRKQETSANAHTTDGMDKRKIFHKILALNELNFYQKLELFQKMGIHIDIPADLQPDFAVYLNHNMCAAQKENRLWNRCKMLDSNTRFTGLWMLHNYLTRRDEAAVKDLHLKNVTFVKDNIRTRMSNGVEAMDIENGHVRPATVNPVRKVAKIKHVVFGTGDARTLVIVGTDSHVLIWNLLTLRLQSSWKLTVRFITVDPCTGLVAVCTVYDELYVLNPSKQYVLYHRRKVPRFLGGVWLPRREPRKSSLDVDWQSVSQLFLLTRSQELVYLVPDNDEDLFADRNTNLKQVDQLEPQTHFGAMIARQVTNDAAASAGHRNIAGGLIGEPTKIGVNAITNLQTHTMAPIHLLSYGFLRSLNSNEVVQLKNPSRANNEIDDADMDDSDIEEIIELNTTVPERSESTVNREEDLEQRNAALNSLLNEKPKHGLLFTKRPNGDVQ